MKTIKDLLFEMGAIMSGHFVLTSGLHSNQYIEKFRVLEDPDSLDFIFYISTIVLFFTIFLLKISIKNECIKTQSDIENLNEHIDYKGPLISLHKKKLITNLLMQLRIYHYLIYLIMVLHDGLELCQLNVKSRMM